MILYLVLDLFSIAYFMSHSPNEIKGPDGTEGFASGWTSRVSLFFTPESEDVSIIAPQDDLASNHVIDEKDDSQCVIASVDIQNIEVSNNSSAPIEQQETNEIHEEIQE